MGSLVLDAQPLIAIIADEPIAPVVEQRLRDHAARGGLIVSAVNWCEVLYMSHRLLGEFATARIAGLAEQASIAIVDVDADLAGYAAEIKTRHRLGLGDCFAAGLAIATGSPLLTGDADFLPLAADGLTLDWLE
jgi:uncharacterized protein with PIN domain